MKFEQGKVYTHQNMLDVVMLVHQTWSVHKDYVRLRVNWFNRRGMDLNAQEVIKVNKSEFKRWYQWDGQTEDWY